MEPCLHQKKNVVPFNYFNLVSYENKDIDSYVTCPSVAIPAINFRTSAAFYKPQIPEVRSL